MPEIMPLPTEQSGWDIFNVVCK